MALTENILTKAKIHDKPSLSTLNDFIQGEDELVENRISWKGFRMRHSPLKQANRIDEQRRRIEFAKGPDIFAHNIFINNMRRSIILEMRDLMHLSFKSAKRLQIKCGWPQPLEAS